MQSRNRLFFSQTVALHREYIRPLSIDHLTEESRELTGIDEKVLFDSDIDLAQAMKRVKSQ